MHSKTSLAFFGGVFLFLDRLVKYFALTRWLAPHLLFNSVGWEPFFNRGIAFGIGIPVPVIVAVTVPIIALLGFMLVHEPEHLRALTALPVFGLVLVLAGSLSNLFDRIVYHQTVDYIRLYTSIINLADVYIVVGFILFFWFGRGVKKEMKKVL